MDQLRVLAYLDLLNNVSAATRIARAAAGAAQGGGDPETSRPPGRAGGEGAAPGGGPDGAAGGSPVEGTGEDRTGPGCDGPGGAVQAIAVPAAARTSATTAAVPAAIGAAAAAVVTDQAGPATDRPTAAADPRTLIPPTSTAHAAEKTLGTALRMTARTPGTAVPAVRAIAVRVTVMPAARSRRWQPGSTSRSRWPPCSASPTGPAPATAWARSTPRWPTTSRPPRREARTATGA